MRKRNNDSLVKARKVKNNEFYTKYTDVREEMSAYKDKFKGKVIYLAADNPSFSNFYRYFRDNFDELELKRLITTHLKEDIRGEKYILYKENNEYIEIITTMENASMIDSECLEIIREADIIITNPPFSLFRNFLDILMKEKKDFILLGSKNAVIYRNVIDYLKENRLFFGKIANKNLIFTDQEGNNKRIAVSFFTSFKIEREEDEIIKKKKRSKKKKKIDNTNIIFIEKTEDIDFEEREEIAVPLSFIYKKEAKEFEIIDVLNNIKVNNKKVFSRILVKRKEAS